MAALGSTDYGSDDDTTTAIYDLMCDLMHFADRVDPTAGGYHCLHMAEYHYTAEVQEDALDAA
jgi:hypothetical protein